MCRHGAESAKVGTCDGCFEFAWHVTRASSQGCFLVNLHFR